ncbi:hypothetical protein EA58_14810 [Photobacterium galatheae]|uniref:ATP-dependent Clp protease ATP-binding subunit ClpX n=2 Tax=Photobacterium galatheae TaxID=1654360 RepID=A0A066RUF1_9GAMM|nr:hypothetical protein EA58_14810 [Photobacterium galatheae]
MLCKPCILDGYEFLSAQSRQANKEEQDRTHKDAMEMVMEDVSELRKPRELVALLDEYVIGQHDAKQMLSVAIYQHQKRIILNKHGFGSQAKKSNLLLIGPTGTGKTLLAETIAALTDLPIHIQDATPLTEAGYIGDSVEDMLAELIQKCDGDIGLAESKGIIFIDEIDKLRKRGDSANLNRDPSGDGVQSALLKLCEGADVRVPVSGGRKQQAAKTQTINTSNILFIASGAFEGIDEILDKESGTKKRIGFVADETPETRVKENAGMKHVNAKHIVQYGMKPEFVGRFSTIVHLEPLTMDVMKQIITDSKRSMFAGHRLLALADNIDLSITDEAVEAVAHHAFEQKVGARGLDGTMNKVLKEFSFDSPSENIDSFVITESVVKHALSDSDSPEL